MITGLRFSAGMALLGFVYAGAGPGAYTGSEPVTIIGGSALEVIASPERDDSGSLVWHIAARAQEGLRMPQPVGRTQGDAAIAAPSFSRIEVSPDGRVRFEGHGTPGARVTLNSMGQPLGSALVTPRGDWEVQLQSGLTAGLHVFNSEAAIPGDGPAIPGGDVRIAIPRAFGSEDAKANDISSAPQADDGGSESALRQRAEELARDATRHFDEFQIRQMTEADTAKPDSPAVSPGAARRPTDKTNENAAGEGGILFRLQDWLARANRDFQGKVVRRLQIPPPSETATTAAEDDTAKAAAAAEAESLAKAKAAQRAEAERIAAKRAADARREAERKAAAAADARDAEAAHQAEAQRKAEQQRQAEEARQVAARKQAEEQRLAAEEAARIKADAEREAAAALAAAQRKLERERFERELLQAEIEERRLRAELAEARKRAAQSRRIAGGNERKAAKKPMAPQTPQPAPKVAAPAPPQTPPLATARNARPSPTPAGRGSPALRGGDGTGDDDVIATVPKTAARIKSAGGNDGHVMPEAWRRRAELMSQRGEVADETPRRSEVLGTRMVMRTRCARAGRRISLPGTYVVERGDSLWRISERHYRRGYLWPEIQRANTEKIDDPDLIYPCQRFYLPKLRRRP
ncbi:MAG: LysM peptidoglycan-binding domain-containing protein [Hyphomicrobiaceae bacterium]|nr:LysM peptidoglycan-binding domain-containing protein [Hyphomicrobiaceae bacterium]